MSVLGHIEALSEKHSQLESLIRAEQSRPLPDFSAISDLKKRKLQLKQELSGFDSTLPRRHQA